VFQDSCGQNYTVYCGANSNPGSVATRPAVSLLHCMQQCDAYTGCKAATLVGNACYIKTGFSNTVSDGGANTVVRIIPPNPAFPAPQQAPCANCSTGCGTPLANGYVAGGNTVDVGNVVGPDGKTRSISIHIPKYYDITKASPLIFGFPGNAADKVEIESQTGMSNGDTNPYGIMVCSLADATWSWRQAKCKALCSS